MPGRKSLVAQTVPELLARGRESDAAVLGANGLALTFGELREQVAHLGRQLAGAGIGSGDRVAIVLPNGPAATTSFLAVASVATAAPLNSAYTQDEFTFYFQDLGARALLTDGVSTPADVAAIALDIPRLLLTQSAGAWSIASAATSVSQPTPPGPGDTALILHTSGTTGRPKRVPLTHANLCASAANIAACLQLSPEDRCLNVMPLFHIHGLVAAVLASLAAGGSVACTPGFDAFRFFESLREFRPTWYTAVPAMHQGILKRSGAHESLAREAGLRLARSSSAPLPPVILERIEALFGVPLVEAYGMTEASHQIACNPLPPAARKPGSVGLPTGVDVAILDAAGSAFEPGARGEVGIRGSNVTAGYEGVDPSESFTSDGFLRTGDEGYLDADGYMVLTGRIKEMINRGGEKVSPREVEEVLLQHPGVDQVVVFALPHASLGEEVAAAIVPSSAAGDSLAQDVRAFAETRLARFKVPRQITLLEELPRGPTGKPQRIGLAERLGLK